MIATLPFAFEKSATSSRCYTFFLAGMIRQLLLDGVSLIKMEGEIVGHPGRSGSGKSTLHRIKPGLSMPGSGEVLYCEIPFTVVEKRLSMVFQNFALFPWFTVLENVELGLDAIGVPQPERRRRALAAIDLIGLDCFESAYPKELSGGMRQRGGSIFSLDNPRKAR
jgi:NitT/TauT family transport system ATP-binding protein